MKKIFVSLALLTLLVTHGLAVAQAPGEAMPKPTEASKAIAMIFGRSATWTGTVPVGAMGPNSPAMPSHGKANCHPAFGGFCYVCDVEDLMGSGKEAMTWKGHVVVGYDLASSSYRGFSADNMGALTTYDGTLDGKKFSLETPNEVMMMGQKMKDRLTWDATDENNIKFTDEHQMGGGPWTMFESSDMTPMKPPAAKPASAPSK